MSYRWVRWRRCRCSRLFGFEGSRLFGHPVVARPLLAGRGVSVHAVLPGPIDTDMVRALDIPKASPEHVARAIVDG